MGNTLYLECYSGISGDMTAAALLDLGADERVLSDALKSIPVEGYELEISRVKKSGIDACDFSVRLDEAHENHDHDMEYLHGKKTGRGTEQGVFEGYVHEEIHSQGHAHADAHASGHTQAQRHAHRGMDEIREIILGSHMTERAKETALHIFRILAEAEAKAHNVPAEQVHFHEVGAVDSIVDIAAVAVCLDNLDITETIVPQLYEGRGTVRCQHGILPVPVPAVSNILQAYSLDVKITEVQGELVTPTGAAIVAAIRTSDVLPERFAVERIGIGAGKREYVCPGILRAMLLRDRTEEKDRIVKLETNIDDCTGENLGYVMELLFKAGARDVHYIPAFMKKNRPAWVLNVICAKEDVPKMERIIFRETTTIGIRRAEMERTVLKREQKTVRTPLGDVQVKVCTLEGERRTYPEYESVVRLCREHQISYMEAYRLAVEHA